MEALTPQNGYPTHPCWNVGDIAYLDNHSHWTKEDKTFLKTRRIETGVTGHPCIILKYLPRGLYAILPISTFGGFKNNPPWTKNHIYRADKEHFRAFEGADSSRPDKPKLKLQGEQSLDEPSWVRVNNVLVVPVSTLLFYSFEDDDFECYVVHSYKLEAQSLKELIREIFDAKGQHYQHFRPSNGSSVRTYADVLVSQPRPAATAQPNSQYHSSGSASGTNGQALVNQPRPATPSQPNGRPYSSGSASRANGHAPGPAPVNSNVIPPTNGQNDQTQQPNNNEVQTSKEDAGGASRTTMLPGRRR